MFHPVPLGDLGKVTSLSIFIILLCDATRPRGLAAVLCGLNKHAHTHNLIKDLVYCIVSKNFNPFSISLEIFRLRGRCSDQ